VAVTGGELLARTLCEAGVRTVFALHGGHLNPFLLACSREGIDLIDGRHEGAVGHSAEGYARATGSVGVAAVTAGAGYANALASLVSAHADRTPLLMITSSPPLREAELNELQGGIDQVAVARPLTRWAHRVTSLERLPDLAALALRKALGTPPGPVLLDVPVDIMFSEVDESRQRPRRQVARPSPPAPAAAAIEAASDLLRSAERPVIVAGSGIRYANAKTELTAFAELSNIPVFSQIGTAWLPPGHRLSGISGWHLATARQLAGAGPDVVLLIGARLGRFLGGRSGSMIPSDAKVIHVDIDATEIGRIGNVEQAIVADARETLTALAADSRPWPDRTEWVTAATSVQNVTSRFEGEPEYLDGRMHPYHAVRAALRATVPDSTIVVDGGETAGWVWESLAEAQYADIMGFAGYLGILGLSTGLAIGAQAARPGRRVVLFAGDGAAGFHLQEFDTMVRHSLPVVMVVVNNALWAQSVRGQQRDYGDQAAPIITELRDTSYEQVAAGFGAYGERVTKLEEVGPALRRAFDSGLPACINLTVALGPEPRTAAGMGGPATGNEIALPYYESIPRSLR
jgi:acetolactate synthase-1/2/3 large subunit